MAYRVRLHKRATKALLSLPKPLRTEFGRRIDLLAENPYRHPALDIKRLQGFDAIYRLRIGQYRLIYEIVDEELLVIVLKIGPRGDVYK